MGQRLSQFILLCFSLHYLSMYAGLRNGDYLLDFPHHHDACKHVLQLLACDWLSGVPNRTVWCHDRLWCQVIRVVATLGSLRAFKEVKVIEFDRASQWILGILSLLCVHVVCYFLSNMVGPNSFQVSDTGVLVFRVGGVLLGMSKHFGEGHFHMLLYCSQVEILGVEVHECSKKSGWRMSSKLLTLPQHLLSHMTWDNVAKRVNAGSPLLQDLV